MDKGQINKDLRALYRSLSRSLKPEALALVREPREISPALLVLLSDLEGPYVDLLRARDYWRKRRSRRRTAGEAGPDDAVRRVLSDLALAVHVDDMRHATLLAGSFVAAAEPQPCDEGFDRAALNDCFDRYVHDTSVYAEPDVS